jgi:DNA helicase-2/ATP-dependent DNA helicase PcrA
VSDHSVRVALRSDARLVVVEAPAGCGKTHQGAEYAREIATAAGAHRLLILTHTHAACSMFAARTKGVGSRIEIRTIDSIIAHVATAYHQGLGLPADTAGWVRRQKNGHEQLAKRVAALIVRYPMIAASLAQRYPVVVCDEHQDSSGDQHAVATALMERGAKLRIFGDPMQNIFRDSTFAGCHARCDWNALTGNAQAFEQLDTPHRWRSGCPALGEWTLRARATLKAGGKIDLRTHLPSSVKVVIAENQARGHGDYRLATADRRPVDLFEKAQTSLLILTRYNETARCFRGFFNRRIPLWEGHTRSALEKLVDAIGTAAGDRAVLATAVVIFMNEVGKGFSPSAFGDRFEREARDGCSGNRKGKPAAIQELAKFLVDAPDHRGIARMLQRLSALKDTHDGFGGIETDCHKEFWDAVNLGRYESAEIGLAEITHHRAYSRPRPPDKAISTIHKAKGMECESVIVMPCDSKTFADKPDARCLLYVALSRAKSRLMFVVSRNEPSPLLIL